jgi:hypothetical protein
MFNNPSYSLADIAAVNGRNEDGFFGGANGWWIILLFMFAFGGGGFGWGGANQGALTRADLTYGFDMSNLGRQVGDIGTAICNGFNLTNSNMADGFAGAQNAMCQGFSGVHAAINDSGYRTRDALHDQTVTNMQNTYAITHQLTDMAATQAKCCCENEMLISRSFADLNYNLANQSCELKQALNTGVRDILENNNEGVRAILDFLTQDKIATLQAENQDLRNAASQSAQNAYLLSQLRPNPIPSYQVENPYVLPVAAGYTRTTTTTTPYAANYFPVTACGCTSQFA